MNDSPLARVRYIPFVNGYSGEVPPFGVMQVTSWGFSNGVAYLNTTRPTATGKPDLYVINSARPVAQGGDGDCTFDLPHLLACDTALATPSLGEAWGPQADSFKAKPGPVYWTILGPSVAGLFYVGRATPSNYVGKSQSGATIAAMSGSTPGSGTLVIYGLSAGGVLVATTKTIAVLNTSGSTVSGTKFLHTKQERETGKHLIDFEDCQ